MALEPIGDIANPTLTDNTETVITWETAADWDNAVSEAGVVHEVFGDRAAADVIEIGYPSFDRGGTSLLAYYPLDEDSTGTVTDVANGNDGSTEGGPTTGVAGLHGTDAMDFDGNDDAVDLGDLDIGTEAVTIMAWYKTSQDSQDLNTLVNKDYTGSDIVPYHLNIWQATGENVTGFGFYDTSWYTTDVNTNTADGNWHLAVGTWDRSTLRLYLDGTEDDNNSVGGTRREANTDAHIGLYGNDNAHFDGVIEDVRIYSRALSASEVSALYDAGTQGQLTTSTKSFGASVQPDLTNLTYSLNGGSITVDVIGSPGTASEEIVSQSLGGASSYTLSWTDSHSDFRVNPQLSITNFDDATPSVGRISLGA